MTRGYFIGIDQGSSSTKAVALSTDGIIVAEARRELPPPVRDGVRVEQDPEEVLASVHAVTEEVMASAGTADRPALGMGLSCQRSSCLAWEPSTGNVLTPVLSWRDTRGEGQVRSLAPHAAMIFERTGLPLTPYYAASKLRWLRENVPAVSQNRAVLGTFSSFLCQRLTGARAPQIDHTNAARTQLMDIRSLSWDAELLELFGLAGNRLPEIVPTAHRFGPVATSRGPVPLLAALGDQQAALLGLGVFDAGQGGINYGTGGFLMVNTGRHLVPVPRLMASVHYSSAVDVSYLVEGSVNAAGDGLDWLRARLGLFAHASELDALCRSAGTDVVVFLGLNGTGAPHWEREIESGICGMSAESTVADIVRGTVEGIAFFMADIAGALGEAGIRPAGYTVSGGLSSLAYLVEAQAALLEPPLAVSTGQETSALGAALLAGMSAGLWSEADREKCVPAARTIAPLHDHGLRHRYRQWRTLHRFLSHKEKD